MFRSLHKMIGYQLLAQDGDIGKCKDFLYDYYGRPHYWEQVNP